jgi:hypothetical protein
MLQVLTHEMIHVATRQFLGHKLYSSIPDWWQEGTASELSGQRKDRLWQYLGQEWRDPLKVLTDVSFENSSRPYLVGSYLVHAILGQIQGGHAEFVDVLAGSGSLETAMETLKIDPREIENIAKIKMKEEISASQKDVFDSYQKSKFLYRKWRDSPKEERKSGDEFRDIMESLVKEHPGTYAGEVANYWLGKYYFHLGMTKDAFESFDKFASSPRHYGLLDDSWYYRIFLLKKREKSPEVVPWCEKYLRLFPDGNHWKKVVKICEF